MSARPSLPPPPWQLRLFCFCESVCSTDELICVAFYIPRIRDVSIKDVIGNAAVFLLLPDSLGAIVSESVSVPGNGTSRSSWLRNIPLYARTMSLKNEILNLLKQLRPVLRASNIINIAKLFPFVLFSQSLLRQRFLECPLFPKWL